MKIFNKAIRNRLDAIASNIEEKKQEVRNIANSNIFNTPKIISLCNEIMVMLCCYDELYKINNDDTTL